MDILNIATPCNNNNNNKNTMSDNVWFGLLMWCVYFCVLGIWFSILSLILCLVGKKPGKAIDVAMS